MNANTFKNPRVTAFSNGANNTRLVGPSRLGPKRCLRCGQMFKAGEVWTRYTSPPDPIYGAYAFGVREACASKRKTIE